MTEGNFDPQFNAPKTDEQVFSCIGQYDDGLHKRNLAGLYRCYRGQGHDVINAWEKALLIAVGDIVRADKITVGEQEEPL